MTRQQKIALVWMFLIGCTAAALLFTILGTHTYQIERFWKACEAHGGHVVNATGGTGYLCISQDGRIIEL